MSGGFIPEWTRWARQGSEHDFRYRFDSAAGVGTVYVDGVPFNPTWANLEPGADAVDVTTYGDSGKTFLHPGGGQDVLSLGFPEGAVDVTVTGQATTRRRPGTQAVETSFRGRVDAVTLEVAHGAAGRAMRDTPPSADVGVTCESCGREVPLAQATYDENQWNGWGEWVCQTCFEWRS